MERTADEVERIADERVQQMWSRCERVARRGYYRKAGRNGFFLGAVLTHAGWVLALVVRFTLF